jgi:predicted metalloprotease with PDZ domain
MNGLSNIISYIEKIIVNLTAEQELVFTPTKVRSESRKTSLKVTLGIMPSYSSTSEGLQIDHVIENKPAFNAGLIRGDLITAINDCKITDITTYINCLSQLEKGATIKVTIIRNTELKVIDVLL